MENSPFAFDEGPPPPRGRRESPSGRKPAGAGSALPWVLGGVGALIVLVGVGVGLYLARSEAPGAKGKSEKKSEGKPREAPPGGDLPVELVTCARDAMAVFDVGDNEGHRERGAGFFFADDLLVGFDAIQVKYKLGPQGRQYTELALRPEDARRTQDDLHYFH